MKNNFQAWIDNADMPQKDARGWYDLETGLRYDPETDYTGTNNTKRQSVSPKAQEARDIAKFFGGKALKGSMKQKNWAEKIRAEKIQQMDEAEAMMAVDPNGLLTHSKFWIENRECSGQQIGEFIQQQKATLKRYNSLVEKYNHNPEEASDDLKQQIKETANEYNALTAKWGWE
jgi:hypothetical protein